MAARPDIVLYFRMSVSFRTKHPNEAQVMAGRWELLGGSRSNAFGVFIRTITQLPQ